jgi:hypothetical protein
MPNVSMSRFVMYSLLVWALTGGSPGGVMAATEDPATYDTPEAALTALSDACKAKDKGALKRIFGDALKELLSGDDVADKADIEEFAKRLAARSRLEKNENGTITVLVGKNDHPFAIPLAQKDGKWFFDTVAGKDEILNRRIGENELSTIAVCRAYVIAQREYAAADRDGDEVNEYAQRLGSSPGQRDGLYWPTAAGEPLSPFGELAARAVAEGYGRKDEKEGDKPRPYHGYLFTILTAQGAKSPGGKVDYVINGNMIAGYALVAYPVDYGNSGIMTFIVNSNGIVLQKDLGEETARVAGEMRSYDRDETWTPVKD